MAGAAHGAVMHMHHMINSSMCSASMKCSTESKPKSMQPLQLLAAPGWPNVTPAANELFVACAKCTGPGMQQPWTHLQYLSHLWPDEMDAQHPVCFGIHHHLHHPLQVVVSEAVLQGTAGTTVGLSMTLPQALLCRLDLTAGWAQLCCPAEMPTSPASTSRELNYFLHMQDLCLPDRQALSLESYDWQKRTRNLLKSCFTRCGASCMGCHKQLSRR